jgi:hypothetical protein
MKVLVAIAAALACAFAHAHSASDAYLTLTLSGRGNTTVIEGQWDIALRDLHFVLALDDDGDGAVTWSELKRHHADIESYAYRRLRASGDGEACAIERGRQLVADRADGAYAALSFRIACPGKPRKVALDYRLFFDVDPTHRGIVVLRNGSATATSLMSPDNARIELSPQ